MARVTPSAANKNAKISRVKKTAVQRKAAVPSQHIVDENQNAGTNNKNTATQHLRDTPLSNFLRNNLDVLFKGATHKLTVKEVFSKIFLYSETEEGKEANQMLQTHGIKFLDYSYRYRMICVFQEQDGEEVLFFCMSVKEYPVQRWCYIDYLDSVSLYETTENIIRTEVYEELIYSYFIFARSIGYERAHIFVSALDEDKEYFFHKRPAFMKLPNQPRLMSWYLRMLKGGTRIVGYVGNERPADGGRIRNQLIENFIREVSYSEFFRNSIEDYLLKNTSLKNFIREIERYPERHGNQLLYVNFKTVERKPNAILEETIEYEVTKSRNNWLDTLKDNNLSFSTREEAKKSTAAILKMLKNQ